MLASACNRWLWGTESKAFLMSNNTAAVRPLYRRRLLLWGVPLGGVPLHHGLSYKSPIPRRVTHCAGEKSGSDEAPTDSAVSSLFQALEKSSISGALVKSSIREALKKSTVGREEVDRRRYIYFLHCH